MKKIVDYYVTSATGRELPSHINNMIEQGWQPLGGVARMDDGILAQTMVMYEEERIPRTAMKTHPTLDEIANNRKIKQVREGFDKVMENLICDVMSLTSHKGFPLLVDNKPLISSFNDLMDSVERAFLSNEVVMVANPGAKDNED